MKSYNYRSLIFKKGWRWFTEPADVSGLDMVDIFSYEDKNLDGFRKKVGLTTVVKLDKSLDDIWSGFRKKFIAEQIKKGERLGIKVVFDKNFDKFFKIYQEFRKNKGLPEESHSLLQREGTLVSAYYGGKMIAGGVFLKEFVNETPWVHMDIAGTAWGPKEPAYLPASGATGVGVRLIYNLIEERIK